MAVDPAERDRKSNVYLAKLAEQAERYDEMAEFMKAVAEMDTELSVEERNLLSVAYKNAVGARRSSWRIVSSFENRQKQRCNDESAAHCFQYRAEIESELRGICNTILGLIDKSLIPKCTNGESKVFYYKMKGDYYRYIAEFSVDEVRTVAADNAHQAYNEASEIAKEDLCVTHPIRLGLALNFSVFHYEVVSNPDEAIRMAEEAFEAAVQELENFEEESYKDSTLIMQLLRDNLTLWTTDQEEGQQEGE